MDLFALNRRRLTEKLKKADNIPPKSFVVLQGGATQNRYCTDAAMVVFRQVGITIYNLVLSNIN